MSQNITIKSNGFTAIVNTLGAELKSISIEKGTEFLWQGDADIWPRTAPVLFPIVGKVKNDLLRINGTTYPISQHGFARDRNFIIKEQTDKSVKLQLLYDDETLKKYPFDFKLTLSYEWVENELKCGYEVENLGADDMPFSIGAHPGFNIPEGNFHGYYIEFEKPEIAHRHFLENGLFNKTTAPVLLNQNILSLTSDLFDQDAIVFKDLKSKQIWLKHQNKSYSVNMKFNDFPHFGIWSKKGSQRFICLEPWIGFSDHADGHTTIQSKEGMIVLGAQSNFNAAYSMVFTD